MKLQVREDIPLEEIIKQIAVNVRDRLQEVDDISEFQFDVEITGRVHEGDLKIVYKLAKNAYGGGRVTGDAISPMVNEFLRRNGWDKRHVPLAIAHDESPNIPSGVSTSSIEDEIPF